MALWGATTADEAKPKYLTTEEKRDVYATTAGWTAPAGGNPDGEREVLVAIGSLSGAAKLADASISSVNWSTTTHSVAAGGDPAIAVTVNWNEAVVVQAGAKIIVTPTGPGGPGEDIELLNYGTETAPTNRALFTITLPALDEGWAPDDVLSVGAQSITGTITPAGTEVAISEAHSTAVGTKTVGA